MHVKCHPPTIFTHQSNTHINHIIMNLLSKEERSELSTFFREQAAHALRKHNSLLRSRSESVQLMEGIQWGIYMSYKNASDLIDLGMIPTERKQKKPASVDHLTGNEPYGTPVHLQQPVDSASYQAEVANHPKLTPERANPHD
jgi:hypothetical protein